MITFSGVKVLFVCPTKVATQSLIQMTQDDVVRPRVHQCRPIPGTEDYERYMLVRDPLERAKSMYRFYRIGEMRGPASKKLGEIIESRCNNFSEFLEALPTFDHKFLRPQSLWIVNGRPTKLIRIEDAESLVPGVLKMPAGSMPRINVTGPQMELDVPENAQELVQKWAPLDGFVHRSIPVGGILNLRTAALGVQ